MFKDDGRRMTLCGILKEISESTNDEKIKEMAKEATVIAKKMDNKLKMYSRKVKNEAHDLITDNW